MTTIILSIIGILLAAVAAVMFFMYGGDAFFSGDISANASSVHSSGANISAGYGLYNLNIGRPPADLNELIGSGYVDKSPDLPADIATVIPVWLKDGIGTYFVVTLTDSRVCTKINSNMNRGNKILDIMSGSAGCARIAGELMYFSTLQDGIAEDNTPDPDQTAIGPVFAGGSSSGSAGGSTGSSGGVGDVGNPATPPETGGSTGSSTGGSTGSSTGGSTDGGSSGSSGGVDTGGSSGGPVLVDNEYLNSMDTSTTATQTNWLRALGQRVYDVQLKTPDIRGSFDANSYREYPELANIVVKNPPATKILFDHSNSVTFEAYVSSDVCDEVNRRTGNIIGGPYAAIVGGTSVSENYKSEGCGYYQGSFLYWRRIDDAAFPLQKQILDENYAQIGNAVNQSWEYPSMNIVNSVAFTAPSSSFGERGTEFPNGKVITYMRVYRPLFCGLIDQAYKGVIRDISNSANYRNFTGTESKGCTKDTNGNYYTWLDLAPFYVDRFASETRRISEGMRIAFKSGGQAASNQVFDSNIATRPFINITRGYYNEGGRYNFEMRFDGNWAICQKLDNLAGNFRDVTATNFDSAIGQSAEGCANYRGAAWYWKGM